MLDVVLIPNVQWKEDPGRRSRVSVSKTIQISSTVQARVLPLPVSKRVIDACVPRGYVAGWDEPPVAQFDELFSFVAEDLKPSSRPINAQRADGWEPLVKVVALSRLIRPTPIGYRYFARVILGPTGDVESVLPASFPKPPTCPRPLDAATGDWLDERDVNELAELNRAVDGPDWSGIPPRLRRAVVLHEDAAMSMRAEERTVWTAAAWDCLTNVDERNAREQFFKRSAQLMTALGLNPLDEDVRGDWYSVRSAVIHGQGLSQKLVDRFGSRDAAIARSGEVHALVETALRAVIRKTIVHLDLHAALRSDDELRKRFPL